MTPIAALAAAGILARLCAADPQLPATASGVGDVRIEGDVTYQSGTGRLLVENGAVLRRGPVVIRARSATFDPATGEVRAAGRALLTDATHVIAADGIRAILGGAVEAEDVVAFVKDEPVDLAPVTTLDAARHLGRNRLSFSGAHLRATPAGRFRLDGARLTLCDCPSGGAPSWEVTARRADVVPGDRAILSWAVLRVTPRFLFVHRPVPVLVLPWLYLPLGDRQSGLLLPEVRSTYATGFALAVPLFVTLGESADATLTAEYAFGRTGGDVAKGAVRGPGARLELRWAPAVDAAGRLELAFVHDLDAEPGGAGGDRFALTGAHAQRLSARTTLRSELALYGDPVWVRDLTPDVLGRTSPYRRSDVLVSHRRDALVLEASASYLQPLRPGGRVPGEPYGPFGADVGVPSRAPAASAIVLPFGAGPLLASARVGATRFASLSGADDPEGRPAAERADGRLELSLPLLLGGAVTFAPYVRGAAAAYAFETARDSAAGAWGVAGAVLGTEFSRRFGTLRHSVAPRVEWRAGTGLAGDALGWLAYDARDGAALRTGAAGPLPVALPERWQQLRVAVESRLSVDGADLVRVELGQDLDLRRGRFAETFAAATLAAGRLGLDASARFLAVDGRGDPAEPAAAIPSFLDRFTELRASASYTDGRGDALRAGLLAVGPGGSGTLLAGLDPLFDLRAAPLEAAAWASAGGRLVLGGATLGYDALLPGRAAFVPTCAEGGGTRRVEGWQVQQHAASLAWSSPCRCFRIAAIVRVTDCGEVSYSASIDLSRLRDSRAIR